MKTQLVPDVGQIPLDDNHPTILLLESIYLLFEIGECDSVLEALLLIKDKHEASLSGPIEVIDYAIELLSAPIFADSEG